MERPIFRGTTLLKEKLIMVKHSFHQRVQSVCSQEYNGKLYYDGDTSNETVTKRKRRYCREPLLHQAETRTKASDWKILNIYLIRNTMMRIRISISPFALDLDPDPSFNFDVDPDPAPHPDPSRHFIADLDPDPAPQQSNADLRPLVYRPSTNSGPYFWASIPALWTSTALHCSILSLHRSWIFTLIRIRLLIWNGSGSDWFVSDKNMVFLKNIIFYGRMLLLKCLKVNIEPALADAYELLRKKEWPL